MALTNKPNHVFENITVPLSTILPSPPSLMSRFIYTDVVKALEDDIGAEGFQPHKGRLLVRKPTLPVDRTVIPEGVSEDSVFIVVDGSHRLKALHQLLDKKKITESMDVPVTVIRPAADSPLTETDIILLGGHENSAVRKTKTLGDELVTAVRLVDSFFAQNPNQTFSAAAYAQLLCNTKQTRYKSNSLAVILRAGLTFRSSPISLKFIVDTGVPLPFAVLACKGMANPLPVRPSSITTSPPRTNVPLQSLPTPDETDKARLHVLGALYRIKREQTLSPKGGVALCDAAATLLGRAWQRLDRDGRFDKESDRSLLSGELFKALADFLPSQVAVVLQAPEAATPFSEKPGHGHWGNVWTEWEEKTPAEISGGSKGTSEETPDSDDRGSKGGAGGQPDPEKGDPSEQDDSDMEIVGNPPLPPPPGAAGGPGVPLDTDPPAEGGVGVHPPKASAGSGSVTGGAVPPTQGEQSGEGSASKQQKASGGGSGAGKGKKGSERGGGRVQAADQGRKGGGGAGKKGSGGSGATGQATGQGGQPPKPNRRKRDRQEQQPFDDQPDSVPDGYAQLTGVSLDTLPQESVAWFAPAGGAAPVETAMSVFKDAGLGNLTGKLDRIRFIGYAVLEGILNSRRDQVSSLFKAVHDLYQGDSDEIRPIWNGGGSSGRPGKCRVSTTRDGVGEILREKDPEAYTTKLVLDALAATIVQELLEAGSTCNPAVAVPRTGGRFLLTETQCARQQAHTDFGRNLTLSSEGKAGDFGLEEPSSFFVMMTGLDSASLVVWPHSHQILGEWAACGGSAPSVLNAGARIPSRLLVIPPLSAIVVRGDLVHAGAGAFDRPQGPHVLPHSVRYHVYVSNKSTELADAVHLPHVTEGDSSRSIRFTGPEGN